MHWYGKKVSRPGRKLGHVTVLLGEEAVAQGRIARAQAIAQTIESIWNAN